MTHEVVAWSAFHAGRILWRPVHSVVQQLLENLMSVPGTVLYVQHTMSSGKRSACLLGASNLVRQTGVNPRTTNKCELML